MVDATKLMAVRGLTDQLPLSELRDLYLKVKSGSYLTLNDTREVVKPLFEYSSSLGLVVNSAFEQEFEAVCNERLSENSLDLSSDFLVKIVRQVIAGMGRPLLIQNTLAIATGTLSVFAVQKGGPLEDIWFMFEDNDDASYKIKKEYRKIWEKAVTVTLGLI